MSGGEDTVCACNPRTTPGPGRDRWSLVVVGELVVAVSAVLTVLGLARAMAHLDPVRLTDLTTVLTLCAAAAGATTAILFRMTAQLRPDPRNLWLCLALLVYTVVAIPAATIGATSRWDQAAVGNIRMFAHTTFIALLYLITWAPRMPRWLTVGTALAGLLVVAAALGGLGRPTRRPVSRSPRHRRCGGQRTHSGSLPHSS
jgi:hypothetical protein